MHDPHMPPGVSEWDVPDTGREEYDGPDEPKDDIAAWLTASIAILAGDDPDTLRRVIRMAERRIAEIEAAVSNLKGGMTND